MRKWCAAVAVSALLALPVCAQQAQQNGDGAGASAATAEKSPAKTNWTDIAPASRNLFALPDSPRPKPFPAGAKSGEDTPPGKLVPKFEIAGMFDYVNFNPGGGFSNFNNYGGSGSFTWNPSRWIGLTEELGGLSYDRNVNGSSVHGGITTYLVGPRVNLRKFDYFIPYAEFLLGGAHAGPPMTGAGSQSAFALAAGGGVDVALTRNLVWRFAEIDYLMTNFSGPSLGGNARQDSVRLGTGIVLRFGLPHEAPPPPVNHPPVAACTRSPTAIRRPAELWMAPVLTRAGTPAAPHRAATPSPSRSTMARAALPLAQRTSKSIPARTVRRLLPCRSSAAPFYRASIPESPVRAMTRTATR
jgi:opacity protein-like surface antigen